MFTLFLTLTIICLLLLVIGFVLMLVRSGTTERKSGEGVGADLMVDVFDEDEIDGVDLSSEIDLRTFRGEAEQVNVQAEYSFSEIKDLLVTGSWQTVLPVILTMMGLIGMLFFGALTLFQVLNERWLAYMLLGLVVYSIVRIAFRFLRA